MKRMIFGAVVVLLSTQAFAADEPFHAGDWMIRARAVGVVPDVSSSLSIGGTVKINNTLVPEVDFTHFFTPNISAELIAAVTPHNLRTNSGTDVGRAWLLPPTLTVQYHFTQCPMIIPYIGAGVNYTRFFNTDAGALASVKYSDSIGGAFQVGADIPIKGNWYANIDVKKIYIDTTAKFNDGTIRANVDIDPWLIGVGVGYKF